MISDLEGMLVEQALQDLRECNKIQSNSVQTLSEICKDMDAYNEAIKDGFTSLERLVLELHTPTAPAPSSHVTPSFPSSAEGV